MSKDFAKATQELLERLRRPARTLNNQAPTALEAPAGIAAATVIYAPADCVIYITPSAPPPRAERA